MRPNKNNSNNNNITKKSEKKKEVIKKKIKIKLLKSENIGFITSFDIFPNKNYIIFIEFKTYKIYNSKLTLIKEHHFKERVQDIKIIDDNNFHCLYNDNRLVNVNIKDNKISTLIHFKKEISSIKYYKNKILAFSSSEDEHSTDMYESTNKVGYQLITRFKIPGEDSELAECGIYVIEKFSLLVSQTIYAAYFWDLKKSHQYDVVEKTIRLVWPFYDNLYILGQSQEYGEIFKLCVYDIKKREIIKKLNFDFTLIIETLFYYKKKDVIIIGGGYSKFRNRNNNTIFIFDRNFNKILTLERIHEKTILDIVLYERTNDLLISYSEDGRLNYYNID